MKNNFGFAPVLGILAVAGGLLVLIGLFMFGVIKDPSLPAPATPKPKVTAVPSPTPSDECPSGDELDCFDEEEGDDFVDDGQP